MNPNNTDMRTKKKKRERKRKKEKKKKKSNPMTQQFDFLESTRETSISAQEKLFIIQNKNQKLCKCPSTGEQCIHTNVSL